MDNTQSTQSTLHTLPSQSQQQSLPQPKQDLLAPQILPPAVTETASAPPPPPKRGPGRPRKAVDPNAPAPARRPVGRPRKDGLPAGSVPYGPPPPKRPVGRPRKDGLPAGSVPRAGAASTPRKAKAAAPGPYAAGPSGSAQVQQSPQASTSSTPAVLQPDHGVSISAPPAIAGPPPEWRPPYSTLSDALQPVQLPPAPASVAAQAPPEHQQPHAPPPPTDDWGVLLRADPNALVAQLVTAIQQPLPPTRGGVSLEEAFRAHIHANAAQPGQAVPALYATLKSFWLPSSPAWFSMAAAAGASLTAPEHRFLFWDPLPLVFNGIPCPYCAAPLQHRGVIRTGPLKVYDFGRPFFVIGCEYACTGAACAAAFPAAGARRFSSADPDVMRALPPLLREEMPAQLHISAVHDAFAWDWGAAGVSRALWSVVHGCVASGMSRDAVVGMVLSTMEGAHTHHLSHPLPPSQDAYKMEMGGDAGEGSAAERGSVSAEVDGDDSQESARPSQEPQPTQPTSSASASASTPAFLPTAPVPVPTYTGYQPQAPFYPPYFAYAPGPPYAYAAGLLPQQQPAAKRIRHCVKCGSRECKGKGGRAFCRNPCQDCGALACQGRNSKRPDKTCKDAWGPWVGDSGCEPGRG